MSNEESTIIQGYLKRMQDEYENFNTVYNDLLTKLNLAQTEYTKQDDQFKKLLTDETNLVTIYSSSTRQNFDTEFEKVQSAAQAKILNISQVPEELDEFIKLANLDLEGVRNQLNEISQNVAAIKDEANAQIDSINRELPKVTEAGQKAIEDMNKVVNQVTASGQTLQQQINELDLRLSGIVNNQSNISKDITAIQETNKAINASQEALLKLIDKTDDRIDQINQQIGDIVKIRTDIDTLKINKADKTFVDAQLAQTTDNFSSRAINVKYPPLPLVGAKGDGITDDTNAIKNIISKYSSLYFPKGRYLVTSHLDFANMSVYGEHYTRTKIVGNIVDKLEPIISIGSNSTMRDISISYDESNITGNEVEGERVAVRLYSDAGYALQKGGGLRNIKVTACGTALTDGGKNVFSASFEDIQTFNATFAHIDFRGANRTGNVYKNIYMHNLGDKYTCQYAVRFLGEESESTFSQINIEHMKCKRALYADRLNNFNISAMHIEGVEITEADGAFLEFIKSNGTISLSVYYTRGHKSGQSLFKLGESQFTFGSGANNSSKQSKIELTNLMLKGLNRPNRPTYSYENYPSSQETLAGDGVYPFYIVKRDNGYTNPYEFNVNNYTWYTWVNPRNDKTAYESFLDTRIGDVDFSYEMAQKVSKTGNTVTLSNEYREGIYFNNVSANGKTTETITGSKSLSNPSTLQGLVNPTVVVNGVSYPITKTLYSTPKGVTDSYDLATGKYIKRINKDVYTSAKSVVIEGSFIKMFMSRGADDFNNGNSVCSHFPSTEYHIDYGSMYFSVNYCLNQGIFLQSDTNEQRITKFKNWLDQQNTNGNPVTLVYELETHEIIEESEPLLFEVEASNTISINDTNASVTVSYDVATNKHTYYDHQIKKLTEAIIALGGSV